MRKIQSRIGLSVLALALFLGGFSEPGLAAPAAKKGAVPLIKKHADPAFAPRRFLGKTVPDWIHTDSFLSWGYSQVGRSETLSYPAILQWGAGLTAGFRLGEVEIPEFFRFRPFFGFAVDWRYLGQYSAFDASVGNFRGTFLGYGPGLGATVERVWVIKLDSRFFGRYRLLNPTVEGAEMSYGSPMGVRLSLGYSLRRWTRIPIFSGFQFEYLSFGSREISGVESGEISPSLTLWQAGWVLLYVF